MAGKHRTALISIVAATVLVQRRRSTRPRELRFVASDLGTIGFITLALPAQQTVADAHRLASAVERTIHEQVPEIHELVVHTEP